MLAALKLTRLFASAKRVGVTLTPAPKAVANLYVWATPDEEVVYIGKAASDRRHKDEERFAAQTAPADGVFSGVIALLRVNHATPHRYQYDPNAFNRTAWKALRDK